MICPVCSHTAKSFARFLLAIYPRNMTCRHCGAELVWSAKWRQIFLASLWICFVSAVVFAILTNVRGYTAVYYLGAVVVASLVFSALFWRYSAYEKTA